MEVQFLSKASIKPQNKWEEEIFLKKRKKEVLEKSAKWLTLSINYLLTSDKLVMKDPSYIPLEVGT